MNKDIIRFLENADVKLNTKTKARGHLGFFCKDKIVISKNIPESKQLQVLVHEFAHKIHSEIEPENFKTGGTLEKLFCHEPTENFIEELICVTNFVDENSKCLPSIKVKDEYKAKVKFYENEIKKVYPDFVKTKKFVQYDKYQKQTKSKTKYFLKYDYIKIFTPWLMKNEFYSIDKLEDDFPELPEVFKNYFYLLSNYRKQKKIQNKIAKLQRYYKKPTELFSRFIEALLVDENKVQELAPTAYKQYKMLEKENYYLDLPEFINLIKTNKNICDYADIRDILSKTL